MLAVAYLVILGYTYLLYAMKNDWDKSYIEGASRCAFRCAGWNTSHKYPTVVPSS
jgi:hypothetical protein